MQTLHLAYLDAGTGSMIASAVVAGAAGVAVAARVGWQRVTGSFKKGVKPAQAEQPSQSERVEPSDV
jgi:hypothetical protein